MADITLQLGEFVFSGFEMPEQIAFGGEQMLAIYRMVGGARIIQALGDDDAPIAWSGIFLGQTASDRVDDLLAMRYDGLPQTLTWGDRRYTVVLQTFTPVYETPYRISYSLVCVVQKDRTFNDDETDVDATIIGDCTAANSLSATVNDSKLTGLMATLSTAVKNVSSFAKAAQSTISSVLTPLNAARSQVQTLIASTENTLHNIATVGGILPNNPLAKNIASLTSQINSHVTGSALYSLDSVLGRVAVNLGQVNSSVRTVTVGGGNLFDLASKYYGDATAWTSIARANNLTDPQLTGVNTLVIPQNTSDSTGVLTA
jgi:hypothetical protein